MSQLRYFSENNLEMPPYHAIVCFCLVFCFCFCLWLFFHAAHAGRPSAQFKGTISPPHPMLVSSCMYICMHVYCMCCKVIISFQTQIQVTFRQYAYEM